VDRLLSGQDLSIVYRKMEKFSVINQCTSRSYFQHCTKILFDNLLKDKFPVHYDNQHTDLDYFLSMGEENTICYVEGNVIASLKKQEGDEELLVGLDSFIEKDTYEAVAILTSAAWVEEINRDSLTRITKEVHDFFVAVKGLIRS